jgi:tetratricopeptide (TPR) repeat protein
VRLGFFPILSLLAATAAAAQSYEQQRATCSAKSGAYPAAAQITACTAVIEAKQEPGSSLGWFYAQRGKLRVLNGDDGGAMTDLSSAIDLRPNWEPPLQIRGGLYAKHGNLAAAEADLNRAIQLAPNDQRAYYTRGRALLDERRWGDAASDFTHAISLDSNYALALMGRAIAESRLGQNDAAQADAARARELDPGLVPSGH